MALEGALHTSAYDGRCYLLEWTAEQSISDNTSTITWELKAVGGESNWYAERTLRLVINDVEVFAKTDRAERYEETVTSGTTVVTHNDDGTGFFTASIEAAVYKSTVNCTGAGTFVLDSIGRKSTLSASNGTLGTVQTLTVTRQSSSFTHTITYSCGTESGTVCTKSSNTSISWAPPLSLAAQNATGLTVNVKLTIETFNGSTSIGTSSITINCTIPGDTLAPGVVFGVSDAMGYESKYGAYIQTQSKVKVVVNATGKEGATIDTITVNVDGSTLMAFGSDGETEVTAELTSGVLKSSGTLTVTVTVIDSRGQTTSASESIAVYAYSAPIYTSFEVYRANGWGTKDDSGAYLAVSIGAKATSLDEQNIQTYTIMVENLSTGDVETESTTNDIGTMNYACIFDLDDSVTYKITVTVTDQFTSTSQSTTFAASGTVWSIKSKGTGMAIGKVAETAEMLDVNWKIYARKGVVYPQGLYYLTLSSAFVAADSNTANKPTYQYCGNVVTVRGLVQAASELSWLANTVIASGIPSNLRPPVDVYFLCATTSSVNHWVCKINTSGEIIVSMYGTSDSLPEAIPANTYLAFCCTYQI